MERGAEEFITFWSEYIHPLKSSKIQIFVEKVLFFQEDNTWKIRLTVSSDLFEIWKMGEVTTY